uniref:Beta-defensin-like domain-containing protein n=1 Tax=Desulfobacca acetoxidans TaxID=60893 RepID=A0A7V6A3C7_9BACT
MKEQGICQPFRCPEQIIFAGHCFFFWKAPFISDA